MLQSRHRSAQILRINALDAAGTTKQLAASQDRSAGHHNHVRRHTHMESMAALRRVRYQGMLCIQLDNTQRQDEIAKPQHHCHAPTWLADAPRGLIRLVCNPYKCTCAASSSHAFFKADSNMWPRPEAGRCSMPGGCNPPPCSRNSKHTGVSHTITADVPNAHRHRPSKQSCWALPHGVGLGLCTLVGAQPHS
jgi:hypothetical protein